MHDGHRTAAQCSRKQLSAAENEARVKEEQIEETRYWSVRMRLEEQLRPGSLHILVSYIRRMKAAVDLEVSTDTAPTAHITGKKRSLSSIKYTYTEMIN